jgi:hypothetical protein
MNTKLTKTIANILGRAGVDHQVGPKAMEMLRYYGVDYEYMHGENGGADFAESVLHFAVPPNDTQDVMSQWDGQKPKVRKGPYASATHEMQCRIFEQNIFNLTGGPVRTYWYELNRAILKHLKARRKVAA